MTLVFRDRREAGLRLAESLKDYQSKQETLVVALPRGGVVVGYEIASQLHLPLDIISARKIGAPGNPELAIGAITESGEVLLSDRLVALLDISPTFLSHILEKERKEAERRLHLYRAGRPPRVLEGKEVILVDDGLATGATMEAAIKTARMEKVARLLLAVPVAPPDTFAKLQQQVDEAICLATPPAFHAVGQFYNHFEQTSDEEVIACLQQSTQVSF